MCLRERERESARAHYGEQRGNSEKVGRSLLLFNPSSKLNGGGGGPVGNNESTTSRLNYLRGKRDIMYTNV